MSNKSLSALGGCGAILVLLIVIFNVGLKPVSDSQIKKDLMIRDEVLNCFYSDYVSESEYNLINYNLVKRQTNKDEKEDIVFCELEIENDYFNINLDLELHYVYYDEGGWILEEVSIDNQECKAISSPNMDLVLDYVKSSQPSGGFIVENDFWEGTAQYGELKYHDSSFNENIATLTVHYESPVIDIWGDYTLDFYPDVGQYSGWVIRQFEDGWYEGKPCIGENYSYYMKYDLVALGNYSGIIIKEINNQGILFDSPQNNIYNARLDFNPITGGFILDANDFDLITIVLENDYQVYGATYEYIPTVDEWRPPYIKDERFYLVRQ